MYYVHCTVCNLYEVNKESKINATHTYIIYRNSFEVGQHHVWFSGITFCHVWLYLQRKFFLTYILFSQRFCIYIITEKPNSLINKMPFLYSYRLALKYLEFILIVWHENVKKVKGTLLYYILVFID